MRTVLAIISLLAIIYGFTLINDLDDQKNKEKIVLLTTNFGDIKLKLYNETPLHRDNFIKLVQDSVYDSLLFHRVIGSFMIQGGDPESKNAPKGKHLGEGDLGYKIPAEFISGLYHKRGALAAAREGDQVNPKKESSSCQFYIVQGRTFTTEQLQQLEDRMLMRPRNKEAFKYVNAPENKALKDTINAAQKRGDYDKLNECNVLVDKAIQPFLKDLKFSEEQVTTYTTVGGTPHLDGAYTVFGEVIEGMNIVDSIAAQPTNNENRPHSDIWFTAKILN